MNKISAIVLAAGNGSRMNSKQKKQFMEINGKPILWYSLFQFQNSAVDEIILVTGKEDIEYCRTEIVEKHGFTKVKKIVEGGAERYHSVYNGLKYVQGDFVLIHDGARPMINSKIIADTISEIQRYEACVVGMPVKDTIKIVSDRKVIQTPERSSLWITQTPQGFSTRLVMASYEKMMNESPHSITDDAMVVEQFGGHDVFFIEGDYRNIKVTTREDLLVAKVFLESMKIEEREQKNNSKSN